MRCVLEINRLYSASKHDVAGFVRTPKAQPVRFKEPISLCVRCCYFSSGAKPNRMVRPAWSGLSGCWWPLVFPRRQGLLARLRSPALSPTTIRLDIAPGMPSVLRSDQAKLQDAGGEGRGTAGPRNQPPNRRMPRSLIRARPTNRYTASGARSAASSIRHPGKTKKN
ncbi:hypothetical protein LX32DRAFT_142162 [Colletotrichum zoysiae]|uniref:Uncharacterized protein n=1 Tax=Colletotrichum zoysiae TaxID=1216348 RepID=A0AAD9H8H6_9PEZI|nr:hypothetical protein LX32DRAFT_142162 [Colletotrichum zoysiae]